jgi:hypothetical protein
MMLGPREHFMAGVVKGSYKLIIKDNAGVGQIDTMLFNLSIDPGEKVNIYPEEKCLADSLAVLLQEQLDQTIPSPQWPRVELTPQERERLRSLGYIY